jgi:hypothetical protein
MAKRREAPEQDERPRPHGDPLEELVEGNAEENTEENRAQAHSDASPDAFGEPRGDMNQSDRADGRGSDANGIPAFDEAEGEARKKRYRDGAVLVSKID